MNPFFFGDSHEHLFGVYHPAARRSQRGVVICYPWAREYLLAHPTLKLLSQRLAGAGWHVLRFDYFGTGDSAGDSRAGHPKHWVADVRTAAEELKGMADVREIAFVGMRIGAVVAAMAAAEYGEARRVVLWDPVIDGKAYLAELGAGDTSAGPGDADVHGAVLTHRVRTQLEGITAATFSAALPDTLVVSTHAQSKVVEPLSRHLQASGVPCTLEEIPDVQVWREEWGRGGKGLAVHVTNFITSWLN